MSPIRDRQMKVATRGYDLGGNGICRIMKHVLIGKILPSGNLAGGPGLLFGTVMWVLHRFGYPLCWLALRFERPANAIFRLLFRLKNR